MTFARLGVSLPEARALDGNLVAHGIRRTRSVAGSARVYLYRERHYAWSGGARTFNVPWLARQPKRDGMLL
jgi:hypothetical protein